MRHDALNVVPLGAKPVCGWCLNPSEAEEVMRFFIAHIPREYSSFGGSPPSILGYQPWSTDFDTNVRALQERIKTPPMLPSLLQKTELICTARHNGELAGIMLLTFHPRVEDPYVVLEDVVIDKGLRGLGVGEQLMSWTENEARCRGYGRWYLETGAENARAQQFFRKMGFVPRAMVMERVRGY